METHISLLFGFPSSFDRINHYHTEEEQNMKLHALWKFKSIKKLLKLTNTIFLKLIHIKTLKNNR